MPEIEVLKAVSTFCLPSAESHILELEAVSDTNGPLVALLLRGALGDLGALGTLGALGALGALAPGGRCRRLP